MRCFKKIFTTGSQRLPLGSDRSLPCFWYCRFPLACCPQRLRCSLARQWPQGCHLCWQNAIVCFLFLFFRADSFILTLTRTTAEVGVYGLAYKVFEVALVLPTFFMNAVYPLLLKQQNFQFPIPNFQFKRTMRHSFWFLLGTSFVAVVVLWFAAPLLTMIKSDFSASIPALRVLSLGLPFFFLTSLTMWTLIALKKQWALAGIYGLSMVINIALNLWLIPVYGYMAAAWITVLSEGVVLLLSGIFLLKMFPPQQKKF